MNKRAPVSAYRLLSNLCDKSIVFVSSRRSPCTFKICFKHPRNTLKHPEYILLHPFQKRGCFLQYPYLFGFWAKKQNQFEIEFYLLDLFLVSILYIYSKYIKTIFHTEKPTKHFIEVKYGQWTCYVFEILEQFPCY